MCFPIFSVPVGDIIPDFYREVNEERDAQCIEKIDKNRKSTVKYIQIIKEESP